MATGTLTLAAFTCLSACRQDMYDQRKLPPLRPTPILPNNTSAQDPPPGTLPRALPGERFDRAYRTGSDESGKYVSAPEPVTRGALTRGQERYGIYCSPCHGLVGDGQGMIVLRGYKRPPSFHTDRLRAQEEGYFVDVITNGFGAMPSYAGQVSPSDRWAIAAYIGALQLSQSASFADLPPEDAARVTEPR